MIVSRVDLGVDTVEVLRKVVLDLSGIAFEGNVLEHLENVDDYGATGAIYAALYVMFGISLGFSLYLVWQQYEEARLTVEAEAAALQRIYWQAENYPDPKRSNVQELAVSYARGRCMRSGP